MKILLADKQDITRAGLTYVIEKMEGLETKYVEDKADLLLALRENEDTVVVLDYTLFDINDADELLILNQRFPYTRWLLFSEDLSADFVKILIASSMQFSILLKESAIMEIKEAEKRFSSFHTVNTHRKNIFRKLGVNNVHEATKYALRAGLVDSAEYYI